MSTQNAFARVFFLLLQVVDFVGDGLMFWRLLSEFLQLSPADVNPR